MTPRAGYSRPDGITRARRQQPTGWPRPPFALVPHMILSLAVLTTALLFGGMTLYSFGFAAILFSALPPQTAGLTLRKAFPWFYLFVIATATVAAALWWSHSAAYASLMAAVALTTVALRQLLMPAINRATDAGLRQRFKWLHSLSVLVTLGHIAASGWLLAHVA